MSVSTLESFGTLRALDAQHAEEDRQRAKREGLCRQQEHDLTSSRLVVDAIKLRALAEPANDAAILFHIVIRQYDGTLICEAGRFVDSFAAQQHGEEIGGLGSRVTVRPDVETSYLHGRNRWPNALHKMASLEAADGWVAAANVDKVRTAMISNEQRAMNLQLRQNDIAMVIGGRS